MTATLARLADLRDKGAITPADYEARKAELLRRLLPTASSLVVTMSASATVWG
ncbi:MAG: SHOCT domain-containing protein [Candidatus Limnocylindrales bacterium]